MNDFNFELLKQEDKWVAVKGNNRVNLPSSPLMNAIWEGAAKVWPANLDDCGANPEIAKQVMLEAATWFAGISEKCKAIAKLYDK